MPKKFWNLAFRIIIIGVGLLLILDLVAYLMVEKLWFEEVGYLSTFFERLGTQFALWLVASGSSWLYLHFNLQQAQRQQWRFIEATKNQQPSLITLGITSSITIADNERNYLRRNHSPPLKLKVLLPLILGLCLLISLLLVFYGKEALVVWQPDFTLPNITPRLPYSFRWSIAKDILREIGTYWWEFGFVIGVIVIILWHPQFYLRLIAVIISLIFGFVLSGNWTRILQAWKPIAFNQSDPLYNQDLSFYIFRLPALQILDFWLGGLFLYALAACTLIYLVSGHSVSQGQFPGFSSGQLRHLSALTGVLLLALAARHWLIRYELLYSTRGIVYGAGYTDIKVQQPLESILVVFTTIIGLMLLYAAISSKRRYQQQSLVLIKTKFYLPLAFWMIGCYLLLIIIGVIPQIISQRAIVQPNELNRETPYIQRSIAFTRNAFALDKIDVQSFNPEGILTTKDLVKNSLTIKNIRLWDSRPILKTNRQLQQIRLYYKFPDADIDRYTMQVESLVTDANNSKLIERQQVIIAPRELDYTAVPEQAQTWVNEHLVYTHGYGFTLSPVNQVAEAGLPKYYVKDIGDNTNKIGTLDTSSQAVRDSIPIGKPRIYYGELTNTYILTGTNTQELDFPKGEENVYNTYDGQGGIHLTNNNYLQRLFFAQYLNDWRLLVTRNLTAETKLLLRRNINQRVRAIAPFLHYDLDPYFVVADPGNQEDNHNYLYWIIDAYTTSKHYPYSDPGDHGFNYIRNSVKVVIDAYNGKVTFYIADVEDPIIQTWSKIFPELFQPLAAMPEAIKSHIRYPSDFFKVQSERLLTYHMTDPQVFYNREDLWEIPQEIYGDETQEVAPYYVIIKLPTATSEEFILLHPYTPKSRPNLIAWLAARSDGQNYGKLLLYQFPKQRLIYGPDQVEALINQDPIISQQISLWNRQGSKAIQGNLLVIPIEQSLLYVEPLYLEAEQNGVPTLARVIVVYKNQIVMSKTLNEALNAIFVSKETSEQVIIRNLDLQG